MHSEERWLLPSAPVIPAVGPTGSPQEAAYQPCTLGGNQLCLTRVSALKTVTELCNVNYFTGLHDRNDLEILSQEKVPPELHSREPKPAAWRLQTREGM